MIFSKEICIFSMCMMVGVGLGGCGSEEPDEPGFSTPNPVSQNQQSYAGDYALDFLTDTHYSKIYIEVDYMSSGGESYKPSAESMDSLITSLNSFCSKTEIIYNSDHTDIIPVPSDSAGSLQVDYTYDELNDLEKAYRSEYRGGDTAVLYFLFVNGFYANDAGERTSAIGFAHHGSSMVILKGMVNSALPVAQTFYEKTVIVHEAGHLLGLVSIGIDAVDSDHVDPDPRSAGAHCIFTNCMMHWAVGPEDLLDSFLSGQDAEFDQCCRDDIAQAGGLETTAIGSGVCEPSAALSKPTASTSTFSHRGDPAHPNVIF